MKYDKPGVKERKRKLGLRRERDIMYKFEKKKREKGVVKRECWRENLS